MRIRSLESLGLAIPPIFRSYGADDHLDTGNYKYLAPPEQYLGRKMSKPHR
jgi:hypothetical protein